MLRPQGQLFGGVGVFSVDDPRLSRSDVDSGIRPSYGEQLLTLSTCEYSTDNGRYVVVARRVSS